MAMTKVQICNLALNSIGHTKFIEDLTESRRGDVCNEVFDACLDEVLEAFEWPFATRHATPAQLDATTLDLGAVPSGWTYAYALPADCVPNGLRRIYPGTRNPRRDQETPFAIEYDGATDQTIVLTDDDAPEFIYTARVTNAALYSGSFGRALSRTGSRSTCVLGLRKDAKLAQQAETGVRARLAKAAASAQRSVKPDEPPAPSWIEDR
jgi:hypothetical protein